MGCDQFVDLVPCQHDASATNSTRQLAKVTDRRQNGLGHAKDSQRPSTNSPLDVGEALAQRFRTTIVDKQHGGAGQFRIYGTYAGSGAIVDKSGLSHSSDHRYGETEAANQLAPHGWATAT